MACFSVFWQGNAMSSFKLSSLYSTIVRCCLVVFSVFYIQFSFASVGEKLQEQVQGIDPSKIIGVLSQLMGQSEAECRSPYKDGEPAESVSCNIDNDMIGVQCVEKISICTLHPNFTDITDIIEKIKDYGEAVCHCCMVPSICLLGGVGHIIDLLRVGNYAGLLMGLNNNKICSAVEKAQHASMALDSISGGKCLIKGSRCKKVHGGCISKLEGMIEYIETEKKTCNVSGANISCDETIQKLDNYIADLKASSNQKCGTASKAGMSQLGLAALTGVASLVARECKKDYESDTSCDDKKDVELDECCEEHPTADACEQNNCEGKQGMELECCMNPHFSSFCEDINDPDKVCHPAQLMNDADACIDKCRQDPTHSGCPNLCNMQWHNEVCPEVCKTYQMPGCPKETGRTNVCEYNSEDPCCVNPNGPACQVKCEEDPSAATCQCVSNPGRCRCDREEDIPYIPEGQCSTNDDLSSECEDPSDPACGIGRTTSNDFPGYGSSGNDDDGTHTGDTQWPGGPPFLDMGADDSGDNDSGTSTGGGPTTYASSGGGSGGGVGGGGGLGGGSGGGSDEGETGEGMGEEEDPYDNILAGLSGDQNKDQSFGGVGSGGRGNRSGSSGFDLKKFLPKKKKDKKAANKKENRVPSSMDSVFDISSQMMGRYCENNNMNCIEQ